MARAPILVVEDDKGLQETMKMLLSLEGFSVSCASNGQEALKVLAEIPRPCVILLDLMMPVMNGWQFVEELEKSNSPSDLSVIVVSAYQDKAETIKAQGFVKKPVDIDKLLSLVRRFCG